MKKVASWRPTYLLRPSKNTGNISRKRERARTRKTPHPPGENALKLSGYDIFSERVHRRQRRKTGRTFSVRPWTTIISNEEGNDRLPVASDILSRAIMSRLDGERAVIVPNKYLSSRVGGFEGVQISRIESKSMQKNFVREILWLSTRRNDIQIWVADESESGRQL